MTQIKAEDRVQINLFFLNLRLSALSAALLEPYLARTAGLSVPLKRARDCLKVIERRRSGTPFPSSAVTHVRRHYAVARRGVQEAPRARPADRRQRQGRSARGPPRVP